MNNKILAGVLGVVVVLGGAYFFMGDKESATTNNSSQNSIAVGEPNPSTPTGENSGKKMSFDAFLQQGGSYVCSVSQFVQNMESKGTVYVNKGDVRGTFSTSVSGMNINSEILVKDGYSYSWSNILPGQGFKVKVDQKLSGDANTGTSGTYSFDASQIGQYDCKEWIFEQSKFNLPSGVTFKELK